jgi:hypothetical protein
MKITLKTTNLEKKQGTKTAYKVVKVESREITEQEYKNITSPETIRFFKRLGGSESLTRAYTSRGYNIVKVVSTSPDKENKTVREFEFN